MRAAPGLIALVMLAACEGGGDPVEQALRDTAAANHSAAATYDRVETTSASVTDAETAYAHGLIRQNREAVAAARAVLTEARDARVRRTAQTVIDSRTREIAELEALVAGAPAE